MTSKLKYAALFFGSLGYLMNILHHSIGPLTGNILMTLALLLIAAYAVAKFFGK